MIMFLYQCHRMNCLKILFRLRMKIIMMSFLKLGQVLLLFASISNSEKSFLVACFRKGWTRSMSFQILLHVLGTGGQEACLFTMEMFQMYQKYV